LIEGAGGFAGELGHLPVSTAELAEIVQPREPLLAPMPQLECVCGRTGSRCLQTYASATAFVERMAASHIGVDGLLEGDARNITSVMDEAMQNVHDVRQIRALRDIGRLIGRSLAAPVLMLNPSAITLTGSLAVDHVKTGIESERDRWRHAQDDRAELRVLRGRANRLSAARGAAIAAFRGQLYRRFDVLDTSDAPLSNLTVGMRPQHLDRWATLPPAPGSNGDRRLDLVSPELLVQTI
jgi:predicted NBD/HSP70 family sugar kinase